MPRSGWAECRLIQYLRTLASRSTLAALFAIKSRASVLGTYGFDKNGDTTLKSYGLYKVGSDGEPVFVKTLTPTKTVH